MLEKIADTRFSLSCYSLIDFCKELQTLVQEGYLIEESNKGLPQGFVGHYSCIVVKSNETETEVETKVEPKKAGRPAKG